MQMAALSTTDIKKFLQQLNTAAHLSGMVSIYFLRTSTLTFPVPDNDYTSNLATSVKQKQSNLNLIIVHIEDFVY